MSKAFLNFIVGVYVARYLGPESFGILSYSLGLSIMFSIFMEMGVESVLMRDLIKFSEKENELLGSAVVLRGIGGLLSLALVSLFLWCSGANREIWTLTLVCSSSFLIRPFFILSYYFEAKVQAKYVVLADWFQVIITSALRIYFIVGGFDVIWFAISWLGEWVFSIAALMLFYRQTDFALLSIQFSIHWRLLF